MPKKVVRGGRSATATEPRTVATIKSLRLPDFAANHPYCQKLTICGHIEGVQLSGKAEFNEDAQFGDGFWFHVLSENSTRTANKKEVHLHIDVKKRFKTAKKKPPTSTIDALTAEIAKFAGKTVACWISAEYLVPIADLPAGGVIQAFLGLSTQAGKHNLAFHGASMNIDDEQLDELRWVRSEDGKSVVVVLDAKLDFTISSEYIDESSR